MVWANGATLLRPGASQGKPLRIAPIHFTITVNKYGFKNDKHFQLNMCELGLVSEALNANNYTTQFRKTIKKKEYPSPTSNGADLNQVLNS